MRQFSLQWLVGGEESSQHCPLKIHSKAVSVCDVCVCYSGALKETFAKQKHTCLLLKLPARTLPVLPELVEVTQAGERGCWKKVVLLFTFCLSLVFVFMHIF